MTSQLNDYIDSALATIDRLTRLVGNTSEVQFLADDLFIDAACTNLSRVSRIYKAIASDFPTIPIKFAHISWSAVEDIEEQLFTNCGRVDGKWVWQAATVQLPQQKPLLIQLSNSLQQHH